MASPLLEEGFEGGVPVPAPFSPLLLGGSLTLEPSRSPRSGTSLRVHNDPTGFAGATFAQISQSAVVPTEGTLWSMRALLFIAGPYPPSEIGLLEAGELTLSLAAGGHLSLSAGGAVTTSATLFPIGRWFCLELEIQGNTPSTADGAVRVFIDDQRLDEMTRTRVETVGRRGVSVGHNILGTSGSVPARDLWIDEIAVGRGHLGCPP